MWNRHFTGISLLQGAVLKMEPGHLDHQSLFANLSLHTDSRFCELSKFVLSSTNFPSLLLLPQPELKCIVGHLAVPSPHRSYLMHIWQNGWSKYTKKFTVCKLWIGNTISVIISKEWHVKIQTGVLIPCRYLTGPWSSYRHYLINKFNSKFNWCPFILILI